MPRIVDVIEQLHTDKATFAKVYEKVMGKKMSTKTSTISDANVEKIKYVLDQLPSKKEKKAEKVEKASVDAKVLKSDELGF